MNIRKRVKGVDYTFLIGIVDVDIYHWQCHRWKLVTRAIGARIRSLSALCVQSQIHTTLTFRNCQATDIKMYFFLPEFLQHV